MKRFRKLPAVVKLALALSVAMIWFGCEPGVAGMAKMKSLAKGPFSKKPSVLFILTSDRHGYWGEELAAPVDILRRHKIRTAFASPAGKAVIDPTSTPDPDKLAPNDPLFQWTSPEMARTVRALHVEIDKGTLRLQDVRGDDYDAVVVVGGHGSVFDINKNPEVHRILREADAKLRIIAAECHGTGALAFTQPNLIQGKDVTGYPDAWEPAVLRPELPYVLQDELNRASGGRYKDGLTPGKPPQPLVIAHDRIITSRDPMSSAAMAQALLNKLKPNKPPKP